MAKKSYWQAAYVGSEKSQDDIKSWFGPMADGLTVSSAEILCDIETDRSKKIRAVMTDAEGRQYELGRTLGGGTFSVSRKLLPLAAAIDGVAK